MHDAATEAFLSEAGWGDADQEPLAGDASSKRFLRLTGPKSRALLMSTASDTACAARFTQIAEQLRERGLSAPRIIAKDLDNGLLLLEDFGDALFAHIVKHDPGREQELYRLAVDVLIRLNATEPPSLPIYDTARMIEQAGIVFEFYAPDAGAAAMRDYARLFTSNSRILSETHSTFMLRDYHAENLILLNDRDGVARAGILDFQDAMRAHPAYDLVSLLQDARRDVSQELAQTLKAAFSTELGIERDSFDLAYALLGVQRALRILGVFARLALQGGKPRYVDLIPRVWDHLDTNLRTPELSSLRALLMSCLPPPNPDHLKELKSRCAITPTP